MLKAITAKNINLKRFFVGDGPQVPPCTLHHRRVYILPTRQGLIFSILIFTMLLASVNYNNNLGYMLTFLLASVVILTIFHTYSNLLSLEVGPAVTKPVYAGKQATIAIQITNQGFQSRSAIECYLPKQAHIITDIASNTSVYIKLPVRFNKRGLQPLPRFIVETTFPFGLFRAWSHIELQQSTLVYPFPYSDQDLPQYSSGESEGESSNSPGQDDFNSLRNYQAGDSLYHIHWKAAAKHHILQTKQYTGNAATELYLRWEDSTIQETEARLSQLTQWILLADASDQPYGLQIPGISYPPDTGMAHKTRCLTALALFGTDHAKPL